MPVVCVGSQSEPGAQATGGALAADANSGAQQTRALLRAIYSVYLPNKVVVSSADKVTDERIPLLTGKGRINGKPTAYVCENFRCQAPAQSSADLARQLEARAARKQD